MEFHIYYSTHVVFLIVVDSDAVKRVPGSSNYKFIIGRPEYEVLMK